MNEAGERQALDVARITHAARTAALKFFPIVWQRGDMHTAAEALADMLEAILHAVATEIEATGNDFEADIPRLFRVAGFALKAELTLSPIPFAPGEIAVFEGYIDAAAASFDPDSAGGHGPAFDPVKAWFEHRIRDRVGAMIIQNRIERAHPPEWTEENTVLPSLLERYLAFLALNPNIKPGDVMRDTGLSRTSVYNFKHRCAGPVVEGKIQAYLSRKPQS